jgi:hypothetical protein
MYDEPRLSEAEWHLIIELLEREQGELPVEIHHSRNEQMTAQLHQRASMVRGLLNRLRQPVTTS